MIPGNPKTRSSSPKFRSSAQAGTAITSIIASIVAISGDLVITGTGSNYEQADDLPALALVGVLDLGANGLYAAATTKGLLSIVGVLGSLYPVTTVLLARAVLGERLQRAQDAGIVLTLAGVALIAAG